MRNKLLKVVGSWPDHRDEKELSAAQEAGFEVAVIAKGKRTCWDAPRVPVHNQAGIMAACSSEQGDIFLPVGEVCPAVQG